MTEKILFRGAEAIIFLKKNKIIKKREKKSYRISEIDEKIRKIRTRMETKLMEKASGKIPVPKIEKDSRDLLAISMEFIEGKKLSENLGRFPEKRQFEIMKMVGENIAKIHDISVIHGDLTTSNMIFVGGKDKKVYFIDFGLGFHSGKIEDKAVDLHLLKAALESKHFKNWEKLFNKVVEGYKISKNSEKVIQQIKKVSSRGRYKEKY